jgi:hypothetical protein
MMAAPVVKAFPEVFGRGENGERGARAAGAVTGRSVLVSARREREASEYLV